MIEAKLNFKNKREYIEEKFLCDSCMTEQDENTHLLFCPAYKSLRENKDFNDDQTLAKYIQQVLNIRMNLRLNR